MQLVTDRVLRFSMLCGLIGLCSAFTGCSNNPIKVKLPASDSAPPSLIWNVFNFNTSAQADHPADETIVANQGESYRVILKASNPNGVESIQITPFGTMWWWCSSSPKIGATPEFEKSAVLPTFPAQTVAPDPAGFVLTGLFLIYQLDFNLSCGKGKFVVKGSGMATLHGNASNYYGGTTSGALIFHIE